jgi:hypothetical protein
VSKAKPLVLYYLHKYSLVICRQRDCVQVLLCRSRQSLQTNHNHFACPYKFSGFYSSACSDCGLTVCDTLSSCTQVPKLWRNLSPLSSSSLLFFWVQVTRLRCVFFLPWSPASKIPVTLLIQNGGEFAPTDATRRFFNKH